MKNIVSSVGVRLEEKLEPMPENDTETIRKITRKKSSNTKLVVLAVVAVFMLAFIVCLVFFAAKRGMIAEILNRGAREKA